MKILGGNSVELEEVVVNQSHTHGLAQSSIIHCSLSKNMTLGQNSMFPTLGPYPRWRVYRKKKFTEHLQSICHAGIPDGQSLRVLFKRDYLATRDTGKAQRDARIQPLTPNQQFSSYCYRWCTAAQTLTQWHINFAPLWMEAEPGREMRWGPLVLNDVSKI